MFVFPLFYLNQSDVHTNLAQNFKRKDNSEEKNGTFSGAVDAGFSQKRMEVAQVHVYTKTEAICEVCEEILRTQGSFH